MLVSVLIGRPRMQLRHGVSLLVCTPVGMHYWRNKLVISARRVFRA
jgi:hypothetical protein